MLATHNLALNCMVTVYIYMLPKLQFTRKFRCSEVIPSNDLGGNNESMLYNLNLTIAELAFKCVPYILIIFGKLKRNI